MTTALLTQHTSISNLCSSYAAIKEFANYPSEQESIKPMPMLLNLSYNTLPRALHAWCMHDYIRNLAHEQISF